MDWVLEGLSIAALLALALVWQRAFYFRTYLRLVAIVVVAMIVVVNVVPLLAIPGLDANLSATIVPVTALLYACRHPSILP